jgi:hypothetical protein
MMNLFYFDIISSMANLDPFQIIYFCQKFFDLNQNLQIPTKVYFLHFTFIYLFCSKSNTSVFLYPLSVSCCSYISRGNTYFATLITNKTDNCNMDRLVLCISHNWTPTVPLKCSNCSSN